MMNRPCSNGLCGGLGQSATCGDGRQRMIAGSSSSSSGEAIRSGSSRSRRTTRFNASPIRWAGHTTPRTSAFNGCGRRWIVQTQATERIGRVTEMQVYAFPRRDPKGWRFPTLVERNAEGILVEASFWHSGAIDEPQFYHRVKFLLTRSMRGRMSSDKPTRNWPFYRKWMGW
jgi:hypothetical protein